MTQVLIYPSFDASYYSYLLDGLRRVFGGFRYVRTGFPRVGLWQMALTIDGRKIIIAAEDNPEFVPALLDWCDVYAKVNIDPANIPETHRHKVVSIAPVFGLRVFSYPELARRLLLSLAYVPVNTSGRFKQRIRGYVRQRRIRRPIDYYCPAPSTDDYLFFSAELWKMEQEGANRLRRYFIEAARALPIEVDAAFIARRDVPGYEHLSRPTRIPHDAYIANTQRSAVVFNTPAVLDCHSWKLSEYLALGKAILATPNARMLPAPLEHGVHIHYVEPTREAITDGLTCLMARHDYRHTLERNARIWWETYGSPEQTIRRLLTPEPPPLATR